jgi:hypothetical protein
MIEMPKGFSSKEKNWSTEGFRGLDRLHPKECHLTGNPVSVIKQRSYNFIDDFFMMTIHTETRCQSAK